MRHVVASVEPAGDSAVLEEEDLMIRSFVPVS